MRFRFTLCLGLILSFTSIGILLAQGNCPAIVEQALSSMGENCDELGRNSACYGYNLVTAEFTEVVEDDFFTQPTDIAELSTLESIQTSEMNIDASQWGVALMNVQANIPNSIPGQAVKFVLLGDVEVESAIEPDNAFQAIDAIDVTVSSGANIRSGAGLNFNVIGGALTGDNIPIDGQNADGDWYRTVVSDRVGWIFGELIESEENLADLPIIDGAQRSLMQSFYLRTGFGVPVCEEAPDDTLMIQSPKGIEIDLTVNGADIRIGSTIVARILSPGNMMEFTVVDGKMVVPDAGSDGSDLIVYENFRTTACLGEPENRGIDGDNNDRVVECGWTTPEYLSDYNLGLLFCILEDLPDSVLNYAIDLQCPGDPVPTSVDGDTLNLCFEGNAWGDGRCTSDYWWNAGYFYGQYEAGLITLDDIPPEYVGTDDEPDEIDEPTEQDDSKKKRGRCQVVTGRSEWYIYDIATQNYITNVNSNPGLPRCPF